MWVKEKREENPEVDVHTICKRGARHTENVRKTTKGSLEKEIQS